MPKMAKMKERMLASPSTSNTASSRLAASISFTSYFLMVATSPLDLASPSTTASTCPAGPSFGSPPAVSGPESATFGASWPRVYLEMVVAAAVAAEVRRQGSEIMEV